jgi:hypothetical protein
LFGTKPHFSPAPAELLRPLRHDLEANALDRGAATIGGPGCYPAVR